MMATKKKHGVSKSSSRKKSASKKAASKKSPSSSKVTGKPSVKKTRSHRGGAKTAVPEQDETRRRQMIAEAAYFLAEQRGFQGGSAFDDWLIAEAQVDQQLNSQRS
jgi:hypothetical protein